MNPLYTFTQLWQWSFFQPYFISSLIYFEYVKAKSTSFHLQTVLYELLTNKGFLFNHLTIITPKQSLAILQYQLSGGNPSTSRRCRFDPCIGKIPWIFSRNPLQYSCLENSVDRGAGRVTDPGITKAWTCLSNWAHN